MQKTQNTEKIKGKKPKDRKSFLTFLFFVVFTEVCFLNDKKQNKSAEKTKCVLHISAFRLSA